MSSASPRSFIGCSSSASDLLFDEDDLNLLIPNCHAGSGTSGERGGGVTAGVDDSLYSFMTASETHDDEEACPFLSGSPRDAKTSLSFSVTPHCSSRPLLQEQHPDTHLALPTITSAEDTKVVLSPLPPSSSCSSLQTMEDEVRTSSSSIHPPPRAPAQSGGGEVEKRKKKTSNGRFGNGSSSSSRGDAGDLDSSSAVPSRQNRDIISSASSSRKHHRQQEEEAEEEERRPKGDWDDEREQQEEEQEDTDENGVMLHSGGSSTDGGQLSSNKVEDGGEVEEKKKERPAHACAYCGISSPDCVLKCCCCEKYFCNSPCSTGGSIGSHVIFHLVRSHHNEVMLHPDGPLGE